MRAGLIVPALSMDVFGLNQAAFMETWKTRGADSDRIINGNY